MAGRAKGIAEGKGIFAVMGDEDTCTGFLLAGVGNVDERKRKNFFVVDSKTALGDIENAFRDLTTRDKILVLLITQQVADEIRHVLAQHTAPLPAILEIPSKDRAYDGSRDWIMQRVKAMFGSGRE